MKGSEANTLVDPFILQDVTGTDVGYECSVLSLLGWGDLRTDEGYIAVCQPLIYIIFTASCEKVTAITGVPAAKYAGCTVTK